MTRLDSFIRRLEAQLACLDLAVELARATPGPVLELGLGNGRTYDHLRARLAGSREIFAFDRRLAAHPACVPDAAQLILGDFCETLPAARQRLAPAALVHADTGSGDAIASAELAAWLGPALTPLLAPGAVVVSDQALAGPGWVALDLPPGVAAGRYFLYRAPTA
ncbi:MAG: class I SAM-dependent methyltransferase [Pseudomonadota bacterium]